MLYMIQNYEKAKETLSRYRQEHLLNFYDELNNEEKEFTVEELCPYPFNEENLWEVELLV